MQEARGVCGDTGRDACPARGREFMEFEAAFTLRGGKDGGDQMAAEQTLLTIAGFQKIRAQTGG